MRHCVDAGLVGCDVTVDGLTGVEIIELENINALYQEMVNERGLDFRFVARRHLVG